MNQLLLSLILVAAAGDVGSAPGVRIINDSFQPATLAVSAGQSVTFTNADDDAHTVTAVDGSFDSRGLDTGGVWHHVFTKPGTYRYFCQMHPFMKGTIVVRAVAP
jgi:plastocyanin